MADQFQPPKKRLQKRLIVYFSSFVAITMVVITIIVAVMMAIEIKRPLDNALGHETREIIFDLERQITHLSGSIATFNRNDLIVNSLVDPQGRAQYLPSMVRNFSISQGVGDISIVDFEGKLIYSSDADPPVSDWLPYLRTTLATGKTTIFAGTDQNVLLIQPILYYQTTQGATIVESPFEEITTPVFGEHRRFVIGMSSGKKTLFALKATFKPENHIITIGQAKKDTPFLHQMNFRIALGMPRTAYMEPIERAVIQLLLISGLFICVAIFVASKVGNSIALPILTLRDRVSRSSLDEIHCYPIGTDDELEELARIFDLRTAELIASRRDMEARVKERTVDLEKAKAAAETADRTKSAFLANMSHEIRTPMNSVIGFLDLALEDTDLPENQKINLATANNSAKSLLLLINDILDISKLESGKLELEERPFDLFQMMRNILQTLDVKAREKGLVMSLNVHPALSSRFLGDPMRLRQILINLAGNAIKFTENGSVGLNVWPWENAAFLHFSVSDTGIGIDPGKLESIFSPFIQADGSTSRRFGGTGLGTTISKQLVELMGGRIWVESEIGKGSTFHFTVLMKATDREPDGDILPNAVSGREKNAGTERRPLKILLAEDIEENIALVKIRLNRQGHVLFEARDGREAVELFSNDEGFDAILMDIHMPDMDGLEATRCIRKMEKTGRIPIIALTASLMKNERDACREAGMDAVVGKPVDFDELFAVMDRLLPESGREISADDEKDDPDSCGPLADFQHLAGIDIGKGLAIWRDSEAYGNALARFSNDYRDAAKRLADMLGRGGIDGAKSLAHTLKGVSGNLSVTDVFAAAKRMNDAIARGESNAALSMIPDLDHALEISCASIRELESQKNPDNEKVPKNEFDPVYLQELLRNMLDAMDHYNPTAVEPLLTELSEYLPSRHVDPIRNHVARFKFKNAREEVLKLSRSLELELEVCGNSTLSAGNPGKEFV